MRNIVFSDLADYLMHGREIEFAYKGRKYSITNHSGFWHLCDDTVRTYRYFIYKENSQVYIEVPYEGIYKSNQEFYDFIADHFNNY